MSDLSLLIDDYMMFRQARGMQPNPKIEHLLSQFVSQLPTARTDELVFSQADAVEWSCSTRSAHNAWRANRLSAVRGFASYLAGAGMKVDIPSRGLIHVADRRPAPYIYSHADVQALMKSTRALFTPLRAATMTTLIGLLAVTGMRVGEALALRIRDIDFDAGSLVIVHAKFNRQRIICVDHSTCTALRGYLAHPGRPQPGNDDLLLVNGKGTHVSQSNIHGAFSTMICATNLARETKKRPRLHDLRHTFATRTIIDAYRHGRTPAATLSALAIWLGHSDPTHTYWYLQAVPELAAIADDLLGSRTGEIR